MEINRRLLAKTWEAAGGWLKERSTDLLITFAGLLIVFVATIYLHFFAPPSWENHPKRVTIQAGTGFHDIARLLEENGVVRDRRSFYLLARLEDAIPRVKAGEYEVNTFMTPETLLSKLVRGEVIKYPITIPEGFDLFQIAGILEEAGICAAKRFLEKTMDRFFIASLGLEDEDSLEGYLFPDTYNFPKGFGAEHVIRQMVMRFKAVFAPLSMRAEEIGLRRREVVTLASMVEKEAADDQERRIISAVFHNRLQKGMALQSDPTAVYGLRKRAVNERITKKDLLRKSPYNTYHVSGLPKGPIANPGMKSLHAVLYPARVSYLYFVSKNDGTHYFSSTLAEHNRAVMRYQRRAKKETETPDSETDTARYVKTPPGDA